MRRRRIPQLGAAVLLAYSVIFSAAYMLGWERVWTALTVPSMVPPFADLRMVTGVQKTLDLHLDPRVDDPGDPWNRPFNYPGVWIRAATALHWTENDTIRVGTAFVLAFVAGLAFLQGTTTRASSDAALLFAASLSPAILFAVERGNVDLFVFFVVCVAIALYRRPWLQAAALFAAGVLKLYPAFGLLAPDARRLDRVRLASRLAALAAMIVYVFAIRGELASVRRGTNANPLYSYGIANLSNLINGAVRLPVPLPLAAAAALALAAMVIGVFAGAAAARRAAPSRSDEADDDSVAMQAQACMIAAAIYVGSYWLRSNYDYRLLFTLPAIPYCNTLRRSTSSGLRRIGTTALAALFLALSQTLLVAIAGQVGFLVNIAAKLTLVGAFCAIAACRSACDFLRLREGAVSGDIPRGEAHPLLS